MLALRALPQRSPLVRTAATVAVAAAEAAPTTKGRRRKIPPKRPDISLENPRSWHRPIGKGVLPAYDLALEYLEKDSKNLVRERKELQPAIDAKLEQWTALQKSGKIDEALAVDAELEALLQKANIIEVQSQANIPSVRWNVQNAMGDMSKLSHRHLLEQRWRKDGDLDLLMERLYQMNVIPDVLPILRPTIDLHLIARATPAAWLNEQKSRVNVEPGTFLRSKQTLQPPRLRVNVFHTDVRLYTMLLVDPDVPNPETERYTTFLHWMRPNIPLSATGPQNLENLNNHTQYIPPHPQNGTKYHRYVCVLLPQPALEGTKYSLSNTLRFTRENEAAAESATMKTTSQHLDIPVVSDADRLHFDVRAFMQQWGLDGAIGGGAHMFREVWDQDVSMIYQDILKKPEPRFGHPPRVNLYDQLKGYKKYALH